LGIGLNEISNLISFNVLILINMSLQSIINSRFGIAAILAIGKIIPPKIGFRLADGGAKFLAARKNSKIVRAVRSNQWIITGECLSKEQLDAQTLETFRQTARCLFDFYHNIDNYEAIVNRVTLSPKLIKYLDSRSGGKEGTLMVAPHLSNFDLAGRAMALHGYKVQALSYPQPKGGYQWQNQLRKDIGIDITPMSTENMRLAKTRLKEGGLVLTGLERPLAETNYYPHFFGQPAPVPTSYVRMALQTHSAMLVIACVGTPEQNYTLECSDLIYLKPYDDAVAEIEKNAETVLKQAEVWIRQYPTQWAMFYPVWPFALEKMP
jgi:lauroyl/myristoyl acyltransferase